MLGWLEGLKSVICKVAYCEDDVKEVYLFSARESINGPALHK